MLEPYKVVASYFALSQYIKGLNVLVESLLVGDGESWQPDVIKLHLLHNHISISDIILYFLSPQHPFACLNNIIIFFGHLVLVESEK